MTHNPILEPIKPDTALQLYLEDRQADLADATHRTHRGRLKHFVTWCNDTGIDNLNDLSGRDLNKYKIHRASDVKAITLKTYLDTLRVFIRYCEGIDAVPPNTAQKIQSPEIKRQNQGRDYHIDTETGEKILGYLRQFEYASFMHVVFELMWHIGLRRGALRSIDLADYHPEEEYIELHHRPEQETPLKNGVESERPVSISPEVRTIIDDWIAHNRPDVTDEYGRKPLIASEYGRAHGQTIQKYIYNVTQPCYYGEECPHGRDLDSCEALERKDGAFKCPSSVAPHDIRRSSITHALRNDVPQEMVSDRSDVGREVLEKHYDQMTDLEKMEQRRDWLDRI